MIPKGADKEDVRKRVIVPPFMRKYQHMKCNLNNNIKSLYMSTTTSLCEPTFAVLVNYTDIYFILCLNTTEERVKVWPDELGKGFQDYVKFPTRACGVRIHVHLRPEDEARHKVEETLDNETMVSFHLFFYTKQHCICVGNYQEWTRDVGSS